MKARYLWLCLLCVAGCTSSRILPVDMEAVQATFDASEEEIYYTTQKVLVQEGYLLDQTERSTGTIATEPRLLTGQEAHIQCSSTSEADPLKLAFAACVHQHTLTLWMRLDADPKAASCASSGMMEQVLVEKIRAAMQEL